MAYLTQVLIAVDQLVNAICGGWADETLSSRAHRKFPLLASVIDMLFFWTDEHCKTSYESEQRRLQFPPELR